MILLFISETDASGSEASVCFHSTSFMPCFLGQCESPSGSHSAYWQAPVFCFASRHLMKGVLALEKLSRSAYETILPYIRMTACGTVYPCSIAERKQYGETLVSGACNACCRSDAPVLFSTAKRPVWSCDTRNIASQKLAEKLGFERVSEYTTINLWSCYAEGQPDCA